MISSATRTVRRAALPAHAAVLASNGFLDGLLAALRRHAPLAVGCPKQGVGAGAPP